MSAVQLNMQASLQAAAAHVEAKVRSQQYSAAAAGAAAVARLPQAQVPKVQFNMAGRGAGCSSSAASPFGSSRTASLPTQSTPAPAPAASGDPWPASLRAWVERAFAQCKSDLERGVVGEHLRKTIQAVDVWRHDWEREPLPPRKKELWLPASSGLASGRDEERAPSGPQLGGKKKRRKAGKGWASETHDTHAGTRPDSREEQSKRARRASRFEASGLSLEQRADLARADRWAAAPQQPGCQPGGELGGDIELDFTVAGTSTAVEKKYLRLTSAPDPRTVRPEPLLKQAIDRVRGRLIEFGDERGQEQYIYLWEQMKSVRQDLTVQRIRNDFTVGVYEMHARICLEYDDQAELKQCQAQLQQLYEEGLGSREGQREFLAYSLLYNVGKQADNNVADLMKDLSADDRSDKYISHALQVRAAAQLGNYCAFFRLYSDAPGHSGYVMDTFIGRERFAALRRICRAYQPSVPLAAVSDALAFDDAAECGEWAEDHGATLAEERSYLDCKASKGQLVEHSIAAKREEERKAAERRAEATGGLKGWS
ncbi:hypothetical protein EMIHUDRAFT_449967 [Emiliania huxleyi CCMP1516]|uniref:SAC3/GANP/THP3 conserved domain-containing protein n=2 Tax=Emiliania huxleyi TaxID=2903 RepID=A0A0D3JY03_EMIH1|nr:hypothetical protein EMIHUDRAFT_449967 [Emiliania huxleyi CCMP1516]EOD28388.1 hypothetical protein EMIHUDRAFT_449967 [Emiliania huxleyi CCMP1516]|eukprot:XP_005780817.1 hypothetical protein EMIHUDRAFT_449967 [Emiliania huxleyi CCMP1516]